MKKLSSFSITNKHKQIKENKRKEQPNKKKIISEKLCPLIHAQESIGSSLFSLQAEGFLVTLRLMRQ